MKCHQIGRRDGRTAAVPEHQKSCLKGGARGAGRGSTGARSGLSESREKSTNDIFPGYSDYGLEVRLLESLDAYLGADEHEAGGGSRLTLS